MKPHVEPKPYKIPWLAGCWFIAVMTLLTPTGAQTKSPGSGPAAENSLQRLPEYVLGPEDQISIRVVNSEEFSDRPIQVGPDGIVRLPFLGEVKAGGMTVRDLENKITRDLSTFIRHPQVSVNLTELRSQPVSVLGALNTPGIHQLRGSKTLTEMLAESGGLRPDAGSKLMIVRENAWGKLPLRGAHPGSSGDVTIGTVNLKDILTAQDPEQNIVVRPHDTITVPKASLVYVVGEVSRAGGFPLHEDESISALQALALAGGATRTASVKSARILRTEPGEPDRKEISIDLRKITDGKAPDLIFYADDILFIPNNVPKSAGLRAVEAAIQVGTGIAIWAR